MSGHLIVSHSSFDVFSTSSSFFFFSISFSFCFQFAWILWTLLQVHWFFFSHWLCHMYWWACWSHSLSLYCVFYFLHSHFSFLILPFCLLKEPLWSYILFTFSIITFTIMNHSCFEFPVWEFQHLCHACVWFWSLLYLFVQCEETSRVHDEQNIAEFFICLRFQYSSEWQWSYLYLEFWYFHHHENFVLILIF